MRRNRFAVLLFPLFACSDSTEPERDLLHVEVTADSYVPGDTLEVITTNIGEETLSLQFCTAELERREGIQWTVRYPLLPPGAACTLLPDPIEPDERRTDKIVLRADVPVGVFRLVVPYALLYADEYELRSRASNLFFVFGRQ